MRVTVLLQLYHWKLRADDVWTVPPPPPAEEEVAQALKRHAAKRVQT